MTETAPDVYFDCQASSYTLLLRGAGLEPRVLGDRLWSWHRDPEPDPVRAFTPAAREHAEIIADWHGVRERRITHPDLPALWAHVAEVLAEDRPVTLLLDPFHHAPAQFHHQRHHGLRRIVLTAAEDGKLHVRDGIGAGAVTGWFTRADLEPALTAPELAAADRGRPALLTTIDLPRPAGPAPVEPARLRAALAATVQAHRSPGADLEQVGDAATRRFADRLATAPPVEVVELATLLGGVASARQLVLGFLELAQQTLRLDLAEVTGPLAEAGRIWFNSFNVLLFGLRMGRDGADLVRGTAGRVRQAAEAELAAVRALAGLLPQG